MMQTGNALAAGQFSQPEDSSANGKLNELITHLEKLEELVHEHESRIGHALRPPVPEPMTPPNVRAAEVTPSPIGERVREALLRVRRLQALVAALTDRVD